MGMGMIGGDGVGSDGSCWWLFLFFFLGACVLLVLTLVLGRLGSVLIFPWGMV